MPDENELEQLVQQNVIDADRPDQDHDQDGPRCGPDFCEIFGGDE